MRKLVPRWILFFPLHSPLTQGPEALRKWPSVCFIHQFVARAMLVNPEYLQECLCTWVPGDLAEPGARLPYRSGTWSLTSGVGVTKALYVNFFIMANFDLSKQYVRYFKSR